MRRRAPVPRRRRRPQRARSVGATAASPKGHARRQVLVRGDRRCHAERRGSRDEEPAERQGDGDRRLLADRRPDYLQFHVWVFDLLIRRGTVGKRTRKLRDRPQID